MSLFFPTACVFTSDFLLVLPMVACLAPSPLSVRPVDPMRRVVELILDFVGNSSTVLRPPPCVGQAPMVKFSFSNVPCGCLYSRSTITSSTSPLFGVNPRCRFSHVRVVDSRSL